MTTALQIDWTKDVQTMQPISISIFESNAPLLHASRKGKCLAPQSSSTYRIRVTSDPDSIDVEHSEWSPRRRTWEMAKVLLLSAIRNKEDIQLESENLQTGEVQVHRFI